MMPDIETGDNRANGATRKFYDSRDMRRCIDGYLRPIFRLTGHDTFRKGCLHRGGYAPDWSYHGNKRCEIIGANVKHGASAGLIEEVRVGMPSFHAVIQHEGRGSNGRSDLSIVN